MTNASVYLASYPGMERCTIVLFLMKPAGTIYKVKDIAKYFKLSEYSFKKKMREYGAYNMRVEYIPSRMFFPNTQAAQKFIDEYVSHLILADDLARAEG